MAKRPPPDPAEFVRTSTRKPSRQCETGLWLCATPAAARWYAAVMRGVAAGRGKPAAASVYEVLRDSFGYRLSYGAFKNHTKDPHACPWDWKAQK